MNLKRILVAIGLITLILVVLTGCNHDGMPVDETVDKTVDVEDSMFIVCEPSTITKSYAIIYHKDTKVMYSLSKGGYNSGTLTLLVNPDGSPMLWEG